MNNLPKENIYGHTKKLQFLLKYINKYKEDHVTSVSLLDFGCGNGMAVSKFLIGDNVDLKYYGIDIHKESIDYARKNFGNKHALFLDSIPTNVSFDIIVYADILEHLENPVSVLQEHHSLLKEDGLLIGAVPNGFGPFENEKRIDNWLGISRGIRLAARVKRNFLGSHRLSQHQNIPYNNESGHVQFFTRQALFKTLQLGGFQVECFTNGAFLGAPVSNRFLLRGECIAKQNSKIADFLPYWAVSTWYFTARKIK